MFQSCKNMAVSAALLSLVLVWVCDIMNKAGMRGTSVYYIMSQPFLLISSKEPAINMAASPTDAIQSKNKFFCCRHIGRTTF